MSTGGGMWMIWMRGWMGWTLSRAQSEDRVRLRPVVRAIPKRQEQMMDAINLDEVAGVKRLEDGRLEVRATAKCPKTGKIRERKRKLDADTKVTTAIEKREKLKREIREGRNPRTTNRLSVADYAEQWMADKAGELKASTVDRYLTTLTEHIYPHLGDIKLDALTRQDVKQWVKWASNAERKRGDEWEPYSTATVQSWWRVLRMLLLDAYADKKIAEDVVYRVDPPTTGEKNKREQRTLTPSEIGELVDAAEKIAPRRHAEIATLAYTGMRAGELYGLEWRDIDMSERRIDIVRAVWRREVYDTKTGDPRHVFVPAFVRDAIDDHRKWMMAEKHPGLRDGIVFPADNGARRFSQSLYKPLGKAAEAADIDINVTPQVIRRSVNSSLLAEGYDRAIVQSILGHSTDAMTDHYEETADPVKRKAAESLVQ